MNSTISSKGQITPAADALPVRTTVDSSVLLEVLAADPLPQGFGVRIVEPSE